MKIKIYTDGSVLLDTPQNIGGYAAILIAEDKTKRVIKHRQIVGACAETNIIRMECQAIIVGIEALTRYSTVYVYCDSKPVVSMLSRGHLARSVKNYDILNHARRIAQKHKVHYHWIKGHSGNEYNTLANELAYKAALDYCEQLRSKYDG